ncbi:Glycosyltransferase [Psidium guajava]|nr:Glycosyltransferase [Psidium guajava]
MLCSDLAAFKDDPFRDRGQRSDMHADRTPFLHSTSPNDQEPNGERRREKKNTEIVSEDSCMRRART